MTKSEEMNQAMLKEEFLWRKEMHRQEQKREMEETRKRDEEDYLSVNHSNLLKE